MDMLTYGSAQVTFDWSHNGSHFMYAFPKYHHTFDVYRIGCYNSTTLLYRITSSSFPNIP